MSEDLVVLRGMVNLVDRRMGARVLAASDEFFAPKENLLGFGRGKFVEGRYTSQGKWMDGWETRRRRDGGEGDWCVIRLGAPAEVWAVDVDTNHFLGNHPPFMSVEGVELEEDVEDWEGLDWRTLVPVLPLCGGSQNIFLVEKRLVVSHLRLSIYPDGGVARLRVYGKPLPPRAGELVDLASAAYGARGLLCSDMFFSSMENLLFPSVPEGMWDGWETRRRRDGGEGDWILVELAAMGRIEEVEVDTRFFRGNFPQSCLLEGCLGEGRNLLQLQRDELIWRPILPKVELKADTVHRFVPLKRDELYRYVRLRIYPDGGLARLRLWGYVWQCSSEGGEV
ncbi:MAG: allantoicase [Planctomycetota bacterium]|nr:MAG: allantoicase [Planctomycetota bacterium]